uniref:ribonuclease H n=1 Tax=Pelodiscus sinensis TaxID=13735 RepID=K7F0Q0_PELSI
MAELCRLLNIHALRTTVYHPQTDRLVERFNRTLKSMLRKFVEEDPRGWDKMLPALLFAVREVPQASTGFSPFELLYGRQPRGILDLLREDWEGQESRVMGTVPYVLQLRERLQKLGEFARTNLLQAQETQARYYDRGTKLRTFEPGDRVLLLLPSQESKLLAKWQGPFEVVRRVGPVDYEVRLTGRKKGLQIYHVNLLKKWKVQEGLVIDPSPPDEDLGPSAADPPPDQPATLGEELSPGQKDELSRLVQKYAHVLSSQPGRTRGISHHISTLPGQRVRDQHRPLPRKMWGLVERELQAMLEMGVIEESRSEWRSPIVLVPKPDGTMRFCIDFRKVNAISRFDAYPMPRVDELLERLGKARYLSTLDLTKGYWQIPLTPTSKEKTAFPTPFGLYQFITMPFGLHGAAATFQRLVDRLLRPHQLYATAYIDDIVVYSQTWPEHLQHLEAVLKALEDANLTANPGKCHLGRREVTYLGYTVGRGTLRPLVDKVQALQEWKRPKTKKQIRQFLGLAGYYCRFIPDFSTLATPLSDLTQKSMPTKVQWTPECEEAFHTLKQRLVKEPVLFPPDFAKDFILQTDASERGLGAVLAQEVDGEEHPVLYMSRKLFPREQRYSTIEKEALAVKWATDALRYYLLGSHFRLVTDHAPLRWLHSMKDTNPRIMRWYLSLQPYDFEVAHRLGKTHMNANF